MDTTFKQQNAAIYQPGKDRRKLKRQQEQEELRKE